MNVFNIKRSTAFVIALLYQIVFFSSFVYSQHPSQKEGLHIQIWAELDAFPGAFEDTDNSSTEANVSSIEDSASSSASASASISSATASTTDIATARDTTSVADSKKEEKPIPHTRSIYNFAIQRAKEIAPFIMGGMINGWSFDYVPYDKTRQVPEYFTYEEILPFNPELNSISYHNPQVEQGRLLCWADCERTASQQLAYERWSSIVHPRIHGHGSASVEKGFDGIKEASIAFGIAVFNSKPLLFGRAGHPFA